MQNSANYNRQGNSPAESDATAKMARTMRIADARRKLAAARRAHPQLRDELVADAQAELSALL